MNLKIQTPTDSFSLTDVNPSETLKTFRLRVELATGLPPPTQKLFNSGKELGFEHKSLIENGISDKDIIVVFKRRTLPTKTELPAPTKETIIRATGGDENDVKRLSQKKPAPPSHSSHDFLSFLLGRGPNAPPSVSNAPPTQAPLPPFVPDPAAVTQLVSFGFGENGVRRALAVAHNDSEGAMEWLIDHAEDPQLNTPIANDELSRLAQGTLASNPVPNLPSMPSNLLNNLGANLGLSMTDDDDEQPSEQDIEQAVQRLVEMGFKEEEVREALRVCGGDEEAACAYLLGERPVGPPPNLMAMMNDPMVRNAFQNPRLVNAFLQVLQNPQALQQLIQDPEIGPLITQLLNRF